MSRPRILISNDDGIQSPGLEALAEALETIAEVTVVAPDRERSAASRAISLHRPLRLREVGERRFACDGTPTDAVYLGLHHVMAEHRPDLVASGINMGGNMAGDITYSGTLAAAFEATIFGIPAIAFSLEGFPPWGFDPAARFAKDLAARVLDEGLPRGVLLNVNVPPGEPTGYRITRLGRRSYGETVDVRTDPRGRRYYWIGGNQREYDEVPGSDCNALYDDHLVTVTPLHLDLTAYDAMDSVRAWTLDGWTRK